MSKPKHTPGPWNVKFGLGIQSEWGIAYVRGGSLNRELAHVLGWGIARLPKSECVAVHQDVDDLAARAGVLIDRIEESA